MKIVVTGASGFIGTAFVRYVRESRGWDLLSLGIEPGNDPSLNSIVVSDLSGPAAVEALAASGAQAVLHLAGAGVNPGDRDLRRLISTNADLPSQVVEAAATAGITAVVLAGTCSEYASCSHGKPVEEDAVLETRKLYGATKAAGGIMALATGQTLSVGVGVARLFNVYGPGERPHRLLPSLRKALSSGQRAPLSLGTQVRDFIHVDDVSEGLARMLEGLYARTQVSTVLNLCTGSGRSVRDFALVAARTLGAPESLLGFGDLPLRPDDGDYLVGDPQRWNKAFGWVPAIGLEEGIERTLRFEATP